MSDKPGQSFRREGQMHLQDIDEISEKIEQKHDPMRLEEIQRWLKEKGIIDETKLKQNDLDRLYARMEGKMRDKSPNTGSLNTRMARLSIAMAHLSTNMARLSTTMARYIEMSNNPGLGLRRYSQMRLPDIDEISKKIRQKQPMKLDEIQRWLKEKGVIDEKKIKQKDLDRLYARMEGKAVDFSTFMHELGKETKTDMVDIYAKIQASLPERKAVGQAISSKKDSAMKSIKELEEKIEGYAKSNTEIPIAKMHEWFSSTDIDTLHPSKSEEKKMNKDDLKKFLEQIPSDEKLNIDDFKKRFNAWNKKKDREGGSD